MSSLGWDEIAWADAGEASWASWKLRGGGAVRAGACAGISLRFITLEPRAISLRFITLEHTAISLRFITLETRACSGVSINHCFPHQIGEPKLTRRISGGEVSGRRDHCFFPSPTSPGLAVRLFAT